MAERIQRKRTKGWRMTERRIAAKIQAGRLRMRSFFYWYFNDAEEPLPKCHQEAFYEAKAHGWITWCDKDGITLTYKGRWAVFDVMGHAPPQWRGKAGLK